jgi:transposase
VPGGYGRCTPGCSRSYAPHPSSLSTRRPRRCSIPAAVGQLWAYARDDRPWDGPAPPAGAYVYAPDRKGERPVAHLQGFRGVLQVGGYAGYRALAEAGQVELAFCWSHVRRRFYEIASAGLAPIATEALERIAELYAIEAEIRGRDAEARRVTRCERSQPLIDSFKTWLEAQLAAVSQKSTIAQAIRYALARWPGPTRFLDDGRIEIDSNVVERAQFGSAAGAAFSAIRP